jgi:hypothetical protein
MFDTWPRFWGLVFRASSESPREEEPIGEAIFPPQELLRSRVLWPEEQEERHQHARPIAERFRDRFKRGS